MYLCSLSALTSLLSNNLLSCPVAFTLGNNINLTSLVREDESSCNSYCWGRNNEYCKYTILVCRHMTKRVIVGRCLSNANAQPRMSNAFPLMNNPNAGGGLLAVSVYTFVTREQLACELGPNGPQWGPSLLQVSSDALMYHHAHVPINIIPSHTKITCMQCVPDCTGVPMPEPPGGLILREELRSAASAVLTWNKMLSCTSSPRLGGKTYAMIQCSQDANGSKSWVIQDQLPQCTAPTDDRPNPSGIGQEGDLWYLGCTSYCVVSQFSALSSRASR